MSIGVLHDRWVVAKALFCGFNHQLRRLSDLPERDICKASLIIFMCVRDKITDALL